MYQRHANQVIRYSIVIATLCFFSDSQAQSWNAYVHAGLASYNYKELKRYQKSIGISFGVNASTTEDFAPYLTYSFGVNRHFEKWSLGFELGHGSSGGRVFYEDYSGQMVADQLVKYNYLAVSPIYFLKVNEMWKFGGGMKISYIMHELGIRNSLTIGTQTQQERADFKAKSFALQPNFSAVRYFGSKYLIQAAIGYEVQSAGETKMVNNSDIYLADANGSPVHLKGDGIRLSIGVGVKL